LVVQAAQEHADHASVLLGQTKQFADDIRSQVAASSSDPAFHTYASGLMAYEATPDDIRTDPELLEEFPAHPLEDLWDGQLCWRSPETITQDRQMRTMIAAHEARKAAGLTW
jgi:hypothetical protein